MLPCLLPLLSGGGVIESHDFMAPDFTTSNTHHRVTGLTNGETYFAVVKARDGLGLRDGNVVELSATPAANALSGVFVDVTFGSDLTGDGSVGNPWRHITFALTQVTGPETIRVAPGTYDTTLDGEGFSEKILQPTGLVTGTAIFLPSMVAVIASWRSRVVGSGRRLP